MLFALPVEADMDLQGNGDIARCPSMAGPFQNECPGKVQTAVCFFVNIGRGWGRMGVQ